MNYGLMQGTVLTASMLMIWASWKSLVRIKLRPSVAETRDMTDVLSRSVVWYLGSGKSPMKRKMVMHSASAACAQHECQILNSSSTDDRCWAVEKKSRHTNLQNMASIVPLRSTRYRDYKSYEMLH